MLKLEFDLEEIGAKMNRSRLERLRSLSAEMVSLISELEGQDGAVAEAQTQIDALDEIEIEDDFSPTPDDFLAIAEAYLDDPDSEIASAAQLDFDEAKAGGQGNIQNLIKTFNKKWAKGAHPFTECVAQITGKVSNPDAVCAWLKDRATGTTKWRGKSKSLKASESDSDDVEEKDFSTERRAKLADQGKAMEDGSYPIESEQDLKNAIQSFGRAADPEAVKRHITKRAKALGLTKLLPADWGASTKTESVSDAEIEGEIVPLSEASRTKDGRAYIKIIAPGWGSSGYYSEALLKRDGPKVFRKGLHMYADHPTPTEDRELPERSVMKLSGVLESTAKWEQDGKDGPGLYAWAKPMGIVAERFDEIAPHIGVSIRASGKVQEGKAEGRTGPLIQELVNAKSVDYVTRAGAGGKVIQLAESLKIPPTESETRENDMAEIDELRQQLEESRSAITELQTGLKSAQDTNRRLNEAMELSRAEAFLNRELARYNLHDVTRGRLAEMLKSRAPFDENGSLKYDEFKTIIQEAVQVETTYLTAINGAGSIRGLGKTFAESAEEEQTDLRERSKAVFGRLGVGEKTAVRGL